MSTKTVTVYFDGLCEPHNPGGIATYGFVVYVNGEKVHEGHGVVGEGKGMSNNVAEFSGLAAALEWLLVRGYQKDKIVVRGDSQLAINLINGVWSARGGLYYPYYLKATELASKFSNISFEWVPRARNEEADDLSRKAYEEYCRRHSRPVRYMKDEVGGSGADSAEDGEGGRVETGKAGGDRNARNAKETCMTCRWMEYSGPHIGCFYGGQYRKWLSKKFAKSSKCENYEPR